MSVMLSYLLIVEVKTVTIIIGFSSPITYVENGRVFHNMAKVKIVKLYFKSVII